MTWDTSAARTAGSETGVIQCCYTVTSFEANDQCWEIQENHQKWETLYVAVEVVLKSLETEATMPFPVHLITPTSLSRAPVPDIGGNEFDSVANHTLTQAMRQMVSLLKQADDIFGGLEAQCASINESTKKIVVRVSRLEEIVDKMDSTKETIRKTII